MLGGESPREIAWWWTQALVYHRHVKGILEAAALDPEKLVAPKDIWFDGKLLDQWFESRRSLHTQVEVPVGG